MVRKIDNPARRVLRLKAAAHYLSVSAHVIRGFVQRGELPVVKLSDNIHAPWLLDQKDLDALIERRKTTL